MRSIRSMRRPGLRQGVALPVGHALLALTMAVPCGLASGAEGVPSTVAKLAQTGQLACEPSLPHFCANLHVACAGKTSVATFPFRLRAGGTRGSIEAGPEAESLPALYENAGVEWDGQGRYAMLQPASASGYVKLLADGSYSFRYYRQHTGLMSIGLCR
jgi:hypothetical protein